MNYSANIGFQGAVLLGGFQRQSGRVWDSVPRRSALCKGMNFKTVQWTVLKEGRLCKREPPLVEVLNCFTLGIIPRGITVPFIVGG